MDVVGSCFAVFGSVKKNIDDITDDVNDVSENQITGSELSSAPSHLIICPITCDTPFTIKNNNISSERDKRQVKIGTYFQQK